jgi:outer membrane murein-binding lipoprotein Lpp
MSNEDLKPTVSQMVRLTGSNTVQFMEQVASHIEKLEMEVARLQERVIQLESVENANR